MMYRYYLERGIPHTVLDGLDRHEWNFYLASMLAGIEERTEKEKKLRQDMSAGRRRRQ